MQVNIIGPEKSHLTLEYVKLFGNGDTFVETGTYLGDTVQLAIEAGYKKIHSIELDDGLFYSALKLFENNHGVKIWLGDSVDELEKIMALVEGPATFWLDAHASGHLPGGKSGGSPVLDELRIIAKHPCKEHTIFINDRRLYGSADWSGVQEVDAVKIIQEINPNYNLYVLDGHVPQDIFCASVKKVEAV